MESYKHRYAKEALADWLRSYAEEAGDDQYVSVPVKGLRLSDQQRGWSLTPGPMKKVQWRVNRPGPGWGVWIEYPVSKEGGCDVVWDEFAESAAVCTPENEGLYFPFAKAPPTYNDHIDRFNTAPDFIFDVAIQHKGRISHALEVVNKHPVSAEKIEYCRRENIILCVTSADWILGQIGRPNSLALVTHQSIWL